MDNVFIAPPWWSGDVALCFFIAGLAGGVCFAPSMLRLVGPHTDLRLSRIGYYVAFPFSTIGALLLTPAKSLRDLQGSLTFLVALTTVQALLFSDHPASLALLLGVAMGLRMRPWRGIRWAVVSRVLDREQRGRTVPVT